jgi:NitT/TauT family transport system ATP-binding protein
MTTSPKAQLGELISRERWQEAASLLATIPEASAAGLLNGLPDEQQRTLFRSLPVPLAAGLLSQFPYYDQYIMLHTRPAAEMRRILDEMDPNDRMRLFDELPEEAWQRLVDETGEFEPTATMQERASTSTVLPVQTPLTTESAEQPIIEARAVEKSFLQQDGKRIEIVAPLDLNIYPNTIIALLGASGCGKSTLLRMLTGLAQPSGGQVLWHGRQVGEAAPNVAIVFQSFALFPWLTVIENVEAPLLARGIAADERRKQALLAIETVGLKGFESAYPKELSGGMRQRVGFARALVVQPEVLFMDEPFSALDVLTAENLRGELMELWQAKKINTKAVFIVTHNIEEAVLLADRVIVLGRYPARIRSDFRIILPRPRDHKTPQFLLYVDFIYKVMTEPDADLTPPTLREPHQKGYPLLPHAMPGGIAGLLELLADSGGEEDLYHLADRLRMEVDDLLPITDSAVLLGFVQLRGGDARLTPEGKAFAEADIAPRKQLFRQAAVTHIRLFQQIANTLAAKSDRSIPFELFRDILDEYFPRNEVERQLEIVLDWGRYCQLFTYDPETERLVQSANDATVVQSEPADTSS